MMLLIFRESETGNVSLLIRRNLPVAFPLLLLITIKNLSRKKLLQILYTAVLTIWQIPFNFRKYCLNGLPMKHLP